MKTIFQYVKIHYLVALSISILLSVFYLSENMRVFENILSDSLVRSFAQPEKTSKDIVYVMISQKDLDYARKHYQMGWPWKRSFYGKIIRYLKECGAKIVLMDILFSEESVYDNQRNISDSKGDDNQFDSAIRDSGNVILSQLFKYQNKLPQKPFIERFHIPIQFKNTYLNPFIKSQSVITPIERFTQSAYSLGMINATIDTDHIYRRLPLLINYYNQYYPSLSLSAIIKLSSAKNILFDGNYLHINNRKIPVDKYGNIRLKYYGTNDIYNDYYMSDILKVVDYVEVMKQNSQSVKTLPPNLFQNVFRSTKNIKALWDTLRGLNILPEKELLDKDIMKVAPELFREKIVLIGSIVDTHWDIHPTPFNKREAGVHLHATLINNYINNDFILEFRENYYYIIILTILSLTTMILFKKLSNPMNIILIGIVFIAFIGLSFLLYTTNNILIDMLTPLLSIILTSFGGLSVNFIENYKIHVFQNLVEQSPVGIFIFHKDKVLLYNHALSDMLTKINIQPTIGKSFLSYIHHGDIDRLYDKISMVYKMQDTIQTDEYRFKFAPYNTMDVAISLSPFPFKGLKAIQGVVIDISERKRIEHMREDTERIIRHDLKAPLVAIQGFADLFKMRLKDQPFLQWANIIHDSGTKMLNMINHSLDIHKMEQGTYQLQLHSINIFKVIDKLITECDSTISSKNIILSYQLNGKVIPLHFEYQIVCDPFHIENLLSNLIKNAIEASPTDGVITFKIEENMDYYIIKVHNLGVIPEDIRDHFFEKYSTSGKVKGTGLGTYSALLITRVHNGKISFITSEEEGTELIVELPKTVL